MSKVDVNLKRVEEIGDTLVGIYARCFSSCVDIYERTFKSKDADDRKIIADMAGSLFGVCCDTLSEVINEEAVDDKEETA